MPPSSDRHDYPIRRAWVWYYAVGLLACLGFRSWAAELTVGPGQQYPRIEDALDNARSGDAIRVYPQPDDRPYEKVALAVNLPRIRVEASNRPGQRIRLSGKDYDYSGRGPVPRAIIQFNKGADGCRLAGFELLDAHNESHNGAGIRINQANDVQVRNCSIHNNDMGVMSNGDGSPNTAADQLIESCLIYNNNGAPLEPGQNHNLYLGGTSVTVRGCEVHSSLTGHNIKSRAHRTSVMACYVHDSANREFDLVDDRADTASSGSDALLVGNVIVKASACQGNRAVVHFGQDGGNEHDGTLYLIHNTIVTPFISPVVSLSAPKARAQVHNNIVWDGGAGQNGQVLIAAAKGSVPAQAVGGSCNWLASGFKGGDLAALSLRQTSFGIPGAVIAFADPAKGDYRLSGNAPAIIDMGDILPGSVSLAIGGTLMQYRPPQRAEPRSTRGKPDLGAYEFTVH